MPVHDSLVNALSSIAVDLFTDLRKAQELLESLKEIEFFELKTAPDTPPVVAAGDSSWALKSYAMVLVYVAQSVAIRVSPGSTPSTERSIVADAGYFIPSPRASDASADEVVRRAIQFISKNLEVESLAEISRGAEIALFDGSLFSFLWYSKFPEIPSGLRSYRGRPSRFRDIWRGVVRNIASIAKFKTVPIFISKSIRRSYYIEKMLNSEAVERFGGRVNDLVLIDLMKRTGRLPKETLVLEPVYISKFEEMPRPLNSLDREDRSVLDPLLPITVTYAVFNPTAQPFQITIPGKRSPEELVELVSALYPYSYTGYPDPLKVAHGLSKISSRELRYLLLKLGISSIPTGREFLGETV